MKLIPENIGKALPKLYEQENLGEEAIVHVKLFTPWTNWTWYILEWDGKNECFGFVVGLEKELGYFSLEELTSIRGPGGLTIERDLHFQKKTLQEVRKLHD